MMTIKRSVEHFLFKLNPKNNIWKATKNDVEAINEIIKFVEEKHAKQLENNQLFAKLYISYYAEILKYYQATVFDNEPQKALHKILDTPIEQLINDFVKTANEIEVSNKMKLAGIEIKHPQLVSEDQKKKEVEIFKLEMLEDEINYEEAKDNLTSLINLSLNTYK